MLRLFSTGQWLDIGGVRVYGEWLGISQERYQVLNLAGISEGIEGNIEETATLDFSKQYDGIISLNCFYMMKNPSCAVSNAMDFLKSGGIVVLDFSTHHYWYKGEDGEHWQSFYPREIDDIVSRHLQNWMLIPIGNVFQATLDYYARRMPLKNLKYFLRFMGLTLGSLDHDPTSAMHYVVIGCKK